MAVPSISQEASSSVVILRDHEKETFELARGEGVGERESCPGGPRSWVWGEGLGVRGF